VNKQTFGAGIVRVLLQGAVELLLFFPLLLLLAAAVPPELPLWRWAGALPLCYAAGYAVNRRFAIRRFYLLLAAALVLGAVYTLLVSGLSWSSCWLLPVSWLLAYRGAKLASIPWRIYFQIKWYLVGLLLYFAASIAFHTIPSFQASIPLLNFAGLAALLVTLVMANQANVQQETLSGDREPAVASAVLRNNRLLIGLLAAATLAVVWFRKLQQAADWLRRQLVAFIEWLMNRPAEPEAPPAAPQPPAQPPQLPPAGEPAAWLVWLEKLAYVLVGILLAAAAIYLIYRLSGRLAALIKRCFRWLTGWLNRAERVQDTGYHDEVERLMTWELWKESQADRWKRWRQSRAGRGTKWEDLTDNRERARHLYRLFLQRAETGGYSAKAELTARETVREVEEQGTSGLPSEAAERLANLYDKARYGGGTIADEELRPVAQDVRNKKEGAS